MRFIILGGGCYGTFYARQLLRAADAGAIETPEIVIVDHNQSPRVSAELPTDPRLRVERDEWQHFFDVYVPTLTRDAADRIVPPPFTPHLALSWLVSALSAEQPDVNWSIEPFGVLPPTPYARQTGNGTLTASHADWVCPVHCIEPDTCPMTHGPRHWDMPVTARALAESLSRNGQHIDQVHLFQCLHYTHGVGAYPAAALLAAFEQLRSAQISANSPLRALVGTVSRCHGAMHLLKATSGTDTVSRLDIHSGGTTV